MMPAEKPAGEAWTGLLYAETMRQSRGPDLAQYLVDGRHSERISVLDSSSELVPGIKDAVPVMLKVALSMRSPRLDSSSMVGGPGGSTVLERDQTATLMIRATGSRNLIEMAHNIPTLSQRKY
jgi:hypothetical protein